jgi:fructose-bisphosphate aldolase, class I
LEREARCAFLKVDSGLSDEKDGVHLMKTMPKLAALLNKAVAKRIFGTKMRSFINQANSAGIKAVVNKQFEVAAQILAAGHADCRAGSGYSLSGKG